MSPILSFTLLAALALAPTTPVADLRFEAVSGRLAIDSSGLGQHARLIGGERVPGRSGQALALRHPDDRLRISSRRSLNLGQALTLEAWINPDPGGALSRIIIAKNDEYLLRVDKPSEGGRISFFVHVGTPAVSWEPRVSSLAPPAPGVWQHVAATWDGKVMALYVNGKLQSSAPRVGFPNPNPYPVMVGNFEFPSCHGGVFGGLLDDVRIYPRALSAAEIASRQ